jgi:hypothetical protein
LPNVLADQSTALRGGLRVAPLYFDLSGVRKLMQSRIVLFGNFVCLIVSGSPTLFEHLVAKQSDCLFNHVYKRKEPISIISLSVVFEIVKIEVLEALQLKSSP